jgi:glycosyltransferase involved in cell wall biosynthesis
MSFDIPLFFRLVFGRKSSVIVTEPPPTTGFVVRIAARLRRTPYVYYAADIWSDASESTGAPNLVVGIVRRLEVFALRGARSVIAVTDGVADRVRELSRHDRVTVVPNGIDTTIFTPDGTRIDSPPMAVYAGTTSEWQGADIFVRAMPRVLEDVPDARLVFVGQGSARAELEQLVAQLDLDCVEFYDVVPPDGAARWLRSARAGLVSMKPGQGYDFAMPTKIMASIACGTPVVFAGVGPAFELVEREQVGQAVDYEPTAVAKAMRLALSEPLGAAESQRLARWARDNVSLTATGRAAREVVEIAIGA